MTTVNTDAKFNGLGGFGYTGAQEDRELKFYQANGATSNNLPDAELQFLTLQGYPTGTSEDRWFAYLTSLGYKGSVDDMIKPWWSVGPGVGYLFTGGAPGVWYDPSDYSTLFTTSAGTTPVTAVEQPVGLMLDKSQGLVLGSELVTNGDFSNGTTGWVTASGATLALDSTVIASGAKITSAGVGSSAYLVVSGLVAGKTYAASIRLYLPSSNTINSCATFSLLGLHDSGRKNIPEDSIQTVPYYFTATTTSAQLAVTMVNPGVAWSASGDVVYIDDLSVKELPGNHAFQSTSASRPVLSARYNLLTKTEQFDDAVWLKDNVTVTANAVVAPDGTTTADRIVEAATTSFHRVYVNGISVIGGVNYTLSVYARAGERDFLALFFTTGGASGAYFDLANGTIGTVGAGFVASIASAGNGWYRCSISTTPSTSATFYPLIGPAPANGTANYAGDITKGIFLWGGQLVVANSLTSNTYQRVNTATDYATTGFLPYLKFDGVDDSLSTNSISFTSTDKMSVFAGVRKLSDAAIAVLYELSSNFGANDGTFCMFAPNPAAGNYGFRSRGTLTGAVGITSGVSAPVTNSLTGLANIAATEMTIRNNGVVIEATTSANQGTGNYGNYPLYIGRRGGSSLPFNGQLYSMVIVGKAVTASELTNTENFVNRKTGAY